MTTDWYKPTVHLRFISRKEEQNVLQQLWTSALSGEADEWRDVPTIADRVVDALEAAWNTHEVYERDLKILSQTLEQVVKERDAHELGVATLSRMLGTAIKERDTALEEIAALTTKVQELEEELAQLKRGEFICRKCGLRKDADAPIGADF